MALSVAERRIINGTAHFIFDFHKTKFSIEMIVLTVLEFTPPCVYNCVGNDRYRLNPGHQQEDRKWQCLPMRSKSHT